MISIAEKIKALVVEALSEIAADITDPEITLEHPGDLSHGDYACNVAMRYAKELVQNPRELADSLVVHLQANLPEEIAGVEVAGPGFINFRLAPAFFGDSLSQIQEAGDHFGRSSNYDGQKILIEHTSINLFKPFHIGHLVNNTLGEAVTRLCSFSAAKEVVPISYPSDVSLGIAKAVWGLIQKGTDMLDSDATDKEKMVFMGECYAYGSQQYDDDASAQAAMREINKKIYAKTDGDEYRWYQKGKELNLDYFKKVMARIGTEHQGYIFESEAGEAGIELVREHIGDVYQESDGAVIFKGEDHGLHTRVFINKEGFPTYEAKDVGLLKLKFEQYQPDRSIFITDHEQGEYFKVVLKSAEQFQPEWAEKTTHLLHGRLQLTTGRLSSRLGNVMLAEEMIDGVATLAKEKIEESGREYDTEKVDQIALAALKFALLKSEMSKNLVFDPEKSLSFEGDSGPYLQYTHARATSLLQKAAGEGLVPSALLPENWETIELEKMLYRFPEVIAKAQHELAPHHIATFAIEIARAFNSWYGNTQIIDTDDVATPYKLTITAATAQVIRNALWILGIYAPEEM